MPLLLKLQFPSRNRALTSAHSASSLASTPQQIPFPAKDSASSAAAIPSRRSAKLRGSDKRADDDEHNGAGGDDDDVDESDDARSTFSDRSERSHQAAASVSSATIAEESVNIDALLEAAFEGMGDKRAATRIAATQRFAQLAERHFCADYLRESACVCVFCLLLCAFAQIGILGA